MAVASTAKVSVGTAAVRLVTARTVCGKGVSLSLPADNSGKVYAGFTSGVTAATGFLLPAGGVTDLPADYLDGDVCNLWLVADAAGQAVTAVWQ